MRRMIGRKHLDQALADQAAQLFDLRRRTQRGHLSMNRTADCAPITR